MGYLHTYLSLFSQPLVPPPDSAISDLPTAHAHAHPSASSSAHKPNQAKDYDPVELSSVAPARPSAMFRARSSFMRMVGQVREQEAGGAGAGGSNESSSTTLAGGAGAAGKPPGLFAEPGRKRATSYGATDMNGGLADVAERPGAPERQESEANGQWMKQGDAVRL